MSASVIVGDHAPFFPVPKAEKGSGTSLASRPTLTVDLAAVGANTRHLSRITQGEVMAVVKADAFGHGAAQVARTALAHGATRLGVTSLAEALALRSERVYAPVLSWLNPVDADWARAVRAGVELAVPSLEHLAAVATLAPGATVHLHLDCGLARDGAEPALWPALCAAARQAEQLGLVRVIGLMGHLSCADVPDDASNAVGRATFDWGVRVARDAGLDPAHRHLAATAATLNDPLSHHTTVRVGAGLFGIDPSGAGRMRPTLTLTAPVIGLRRVGAGTAVGYGQTWTAPMTTQLGLIGVGYADGLPRRASNRAQVLVRGVRRPLVGRISMDMAVIDLGEEGARMGDVVTVFGPGAAGEPTVAEWASWADTIEHEMMTGLGPRLARGRSGGRS
ncbi:alanine racemase [Kineosporia sp. NBRC 101731]|uniref:alanine racemase n=1 Tax=Kineosporia sp. NBRC 101731 TaxID=3032199 RepID=UPI0024A2EDE4|nr:alanine racemase [Kineosporia sp. NBRC 101731]GLY26780.1 alanine racemase [Kineosporia sp. NBRC 101731]